MARTQKLIVEAGTHAMLGASASHRWMECPGSVRLSKGVPRKSSTFADEGTAAHKLGELCLSDGTDAADHLGLLIDVDDVAWEVTEEMAEAVQVRLDTIRGLLAEHPNHEHQTEQRFRLDWLYPDLGGTADDVIDVPFLRVIVVDYKHGKGVPVEVIMPDGTPNPQLAIYALDPAHQGDHAEVEIVVVQPRAYHPDGPVRRHVFRASELLAWGRDVLLPAAKATEAPNAPLRCGDWCRFCPAKTLCPEIRRQALSAAQQAFADDGFPVVPQAEIVLPAPGSLSPDDLAKARGLVDLLEPWFKAVKDEAHRVAVSGGKLPGWKLVLGRQGNRAWSDEKRAEGLLVGALKTEAWERKLLSPAKAEKALKAAGKDPKSIEPLVTRGEAKPALVPAADRRPEITMENPVELFGDDTF